MNEAQLQAIIDAAVRKAVDDTKAAFAPMLAAADATNKGLLTGFKKQQGRPDNVSEPRSLADVMSNWEKSMAARDAADAERTAKAKPAPKAAPGVGITPNGDFVLDREAARNPSVYRAAREQAEKAGKPLRIVDPSETSSVHLGTGQTDAPKRGDFTVGRSRYVHTSVVQGQLQQLHAETQRDGKRLVSFRHPDQLPDDALAVYNSPEAK